MKTREQIKAQIMAIQSEIEALKQQNLPVRLRQERMFQKGQHVLLLQWVLADDNQPPQL